MLQRICDALQPGTINVFFQRWLSRLPLPLGAADQQAGYWWELSMAQVEVSRTIVFTQPRYARAFFEALVTDNLDLGRPDTVEIIFGRQIVNGRQRATQGDVQDQGHHPRHRGHHQRLLPATPASSSTSKTAGRCASRPSSTHPPTCGCGRRLHNLGELQDAGRVRSTPGCCTLNVPARAASLRIQSSSGSRTRRSPPTGGELQPCALATLGSRPWPAPCASDLVRRHRHHQQEPARPDDRTARRPLLAWPRPPTTWPGSRRNGLITRRPHANTYDLTPDGLAFAIFYTKVHDRVLAPLFTAGLDRTRFGGHPA